MDEQRKYLIDANLLIAPYRNYYAFDIVPSFWEKLKEMFRCNKIVILDKVFDELKKGGETDELFIWLSTNEEYINTVSYKDSRIVEHYAEIIQYIQTSGRFTERALNMWSLQKVADPWLIATAKVYNYVLVTEEKGHGDNGNKQKISKVKIPDIADVFNVETIDLFEMMRKLQIRI